jgi:hypothetical protein
MGTAVTIPLGLVLARERVDHPWQSYRWRPVSVSLDERPVSGWYELHRTATAVHYRAATLPLRLSANEAMAYRVNLANGEPLVYVVLHDDPPESGGSPVDVALVTASPFTARAFGDQGLERTVEGIAMPDELIAKVSAFIDEQAGDTIADGPRADRRPPAPLHPRLAVGRAGLGTGMAGHAHKKG